MTGWVILVDQSRDLPNAETPHKVITTSEYLARPRLFDMGRPKLVNLARSYAYQSKGYYASLLAEARGHRVVPTVETMLELREQKLYEHALPDLEDELNRCARRADFQPAAEHHPARQWRRRVLSRVAAQSYQARLARSQGAHRRQVRSRRALRPEREDGALVARVDQAFCAHRRKTLRRCRADHQAPARRTRRIRRPVHPRNHLDRQPHLPLRPSRLAGRHAGHRRSDLDDPLHQQGVSDGAARPEPGADAADRHHRRGYRSRQADRRVGP